jgi:uncharacterized protein YecE (DUF72 family)
MNPLAENNVFDSIVVAIKIAPTQSKSGLKQMQFYLGLAIWGYKGWLGEMFPKGSQSRDFLPLYGQRFTAVEGNTTFYAIPSIDQVQRWASHMPPNFHICPKLPKTVTHNGLLLPYLKAGLQFLDLMQQFGDRLGPLMIQLPPRYSPAQFTDLRQFLQGWTAATDWPIGVEVRHPDWFRQPHHIQLTALLEDLQVSQILLDSRPIYQADPATLTHLPPEQQDKKPNVPLFTHRTTDWAIVRYISHPDLALNQPYLTEWVDHLGQWLAQGTKVYFFVHCPIEAHSPAIARHFQALLEARGVAVPPLPWNDLANGLVEAGTIAADRQTSQQTDQQLDLFGAS